MDGDAQGRRRRRTHSPAFKAEVLRCCDQPGVSIAAVALANGLNANLVRRWLNERNAGVGGNLIAGVAARPQLGAPLPVAGASGFVAVQLAERQNTSADIRLELRRGPVSLTVNWPAQEAAACGAWLCEWLR